MRHLSREEYDKVTQEFAQLKTLSEQKKYVEENKLEVEFKAPKTDKTEKKEEETDGLQQDSK